MPLHTVQFQVALHGFLSLYTKPKSHASGTDDHTHKHSALSSARKVFILERPDSEKVDRLLSHSNYVPYNPTQSTSVSCAKSWVGV